MYVLIGGAGLVGLNLAQELSGTRTYDRTHRY
jgi:Trk K+ transport system NAD-binding subunit